MPSLKKNFIFNLLNTVTSIIFPIITFPYAARILFPSGIGVVNFQISIINYIVLFTSLGIPLYAVREVAKYRDNAAERNRITFELLILSLSLCVLGYIAVGIIATYVETIHAQSSLFYLLSLIILFTAIGVQWFYQAVEDFKFITVRALVIRTLAAASLFLFVKTPQDLLIYGGITVASTVGNNIINFVHLRKFFTKEDIVWHGLRIKRHIKPALRIFLLNLIISLYVYLNSVMLGFMDGNEAVGLYTAGTKMSMVALSLVTSLGTVMLPRCSNLIKTGQKEEFVSLTHKSLRFVIGFSMPVTVGLMILAKPVILLFCGAHFMGAIPVLIWTAPIIVFVGLTNLTGIQILYPQNKENIVIWSTAGAAVSNIILNIFLIPALGVVGSAIATFVSEFVVLVVQCVAGRKYLPFKIRDVRFLNYIFATLLMVVVIYLLNVLIANNVLKLILGVLVGMLVYGASLYVLKDELFLEMLSFLMKKRIKFNS